MNKKIRRCLFILCMLICGVMLTACAAGVELDTDEEDEKYKRGNIEENEALTKVSVSYNLDGNITKMIDVDLVNEKKTVTLSDKESKEKTEDFHAGDTLETLVRGIINNEEEAGEKKSDDQRVVWTVLVYGGEHYQRRNGFKEYPQKWDELLQALGEELDYEIINSN